MFSWVYGRRENGSMALFGPFVSSTRAQEYADEAVGLYETQVAELPTRDQSKATSMLKAKLVRQTKNVELGMQKVSHPRVGSAYSSCYS